MAKPLQFAGVTPDSTCASAAASIVSSLFEAALAEAPAVLHERDAHAVHDMRVALRRLRTALDTFAEVFPKKELRAAAKAFRRLARRLGAVRDADVHLADLRTALGGATAREGPGFAYAIETLIARRRAALARFAIELSQFDRSAVAALVSGAHAP